MYNRFFSVTQGGNRERDIFLGYLMILGTFYGDMVRSSCLNYCRVLNIEQYNAK